MPPLPLAKILDVALPSLAGEARAVVNVLACKNGLLPPAGDVATFLGLRTRHQVARTLRRASLPPLEELAAWTRLFYWVLQSEQTGASLLALARQSHVEPATCYRLVRRLMGQPWSRVRRGGIAAAILRFRTACRDTGMHELALQPYLVAAARHGTSAATAVGGGARSGQLVRTTSAVAALPAPAQPALRSVARGQGAPGRASSPERRTLYVATNLDRLCVCALPDNGGRILRSAPLPQACTELVIHPAGNRVYVPTWKAGSILELDARSLAVIHHYEVGGRPLGVAVSSDGMRLYCGNEHGWIDLVHLPTGRIVRRPFETPVDEVALTPDQAMVYASLRTAGRIAMVDAYTLACVGTLETGGLPRHIAFDRLGRVAIVANESGWVDLVR